MATWYACGDDWTHAAATVVHAATPEGINLLASGAVSQDFHEVKAFAEVIRILEGGIVPIYIFEFRLGSPDVNEPTEPLASVL